MKRSAMNEVGNMDVAADDAELGCWSWETCLAPEMLYR
jgi:hypothetical protein